MRRKQPEKYKSLMDYWNRELFGVDEPEEPPISNQDELLLAEIGASDDELEVEGEEDVVEDEADPFSFWETRRKRGKTRTSSLPSRNLDTQASLERQPESKHERTAAAEEDGVMDHSDAGGHSPHGRGDTKAEDDDSQINLAEDDPNKMDMDEEEADLDKDWTEAHLDELLADDAEGGEKDRRKISDGNAAETGENNLTKTAPASTRSTSTHATSTSTRRAKKLIVNSDTEDEAHPAETQIEQMGTKNTGATSAKGSRSKKRPLTDSIVEQLEGGADSQTTPEGSGSGKKEREAKRRRTKENANSENAPNTLVILPAEPQSTRRSTRQEAKRANRS